jgi:hypothetical protein
MSRDCADPRMFVTGTNCPMPDCGRLAVAYSKDSGPSRRSSSEWLFICPICGVEFTSPTSELLFQFVPSEWLLAKVCHA